MEQTSKKTSPWRSFKIASLRKQAQHIRIIFLDVHLQDSKSTKNAKLSEKQRHDWGPSHDAATGYMVRWF